MSRLISLLLIITMLALNSALLVSCLPQNPPENTPGDNEQGTDGKTENDDKNTSIIVPEYKDYQRRTIDFSTITYSRPDIEGTAAAFTELADMVKTNAIPFESQIEEIEKRTDIYEQVLTLSTYSNIMFSQDTSNEGWCQEHEYISTAFPQFSKAVEDLFVAAAASPHAERFENEYFGEGLIEKYKDGGRYTERVVALMSDEASLETAYSELSPSTVEVTYFDITDTPERIISYYKETYGTFSSRYLHANETCMKLYAEEHERLSCEILVELFKIRRLISDELGCVSYMEYAYETIYHDYPAEKLTAFLSDIKTYILPIFVTSMNSDDFDLILNENTAEPLDRIKLINTVYEMLTDSLPELAPIFAYMLQHGLYSIESSTEKRREGAFTAYLYQYDAPYIFMSTAGNINDYSTLCHEFGHFADAYINNGGLSSLDLSEVSSQGLELLSILHLKEKIDQKDYKYLNDLAMINAMSVMVFQGFYAMFEHIAYKIPYDTISRETLDLAVKNAADAMNLNSSILNDLSIVSSVQHIALYPSYVQSYCTSMTVALDIYFLEKSDTGAGFSSYYTLIKRGKSNFAFEKALECAQLPSPFESDRLKDVGDSVFYNLFGKYFFQNVPDTNVA